LVRFVVQFWAPFVLVGLAAVFIGQNRDRQQVRFLWLTVESPMWLLLAAMLLVGVAVGLLLRRRRR
jgi:LPXTG-motif cell wall-anchored protein